MPKKAKNPPKKAKNPPKMTKNFGFETSEKIREISDLKLFDYFDLGEHTF